MILLMLSVAIASLLAFPHVRDFLRIRRQTHHIMKKHADVPIEEWSKQAARHLLSAMQRYGEIGKEDLAPLWAQTYKYAAIIKMRGEHIPTILCCMGWAYQDAELVAQSPHYDAVKRKMVMAIAVDMRVSNLPITNHLVKVLGRKITSLENEAFAKLEKSVRWDGKSNEYVLIEDFDDAGQKSPDVESA